MMQMDAKIIRYLLIVFFTTFLFLCTGTNCDLTTKERIQLHKAWLEQRRSSLNRYRNQSAVRNETEARITYLRKLIKFKNTREPMLSENDVAFVPDFYSTSTPTVPPILNTTNTTTEINLLNTTTTTQVMNATEATTFKETAPNYAASTEPSATLTTTYQPAAQEEQTLEKVEVTTIIEATTSLPVTTTEAIRADELVMKSVFTSWSNWTSCSRSCGGGIKSQLRKCVKRTYVNGKKVITSKTVPSNECIGIYKRYHICNDHVCPPNSTIDFRDAQCKHFDNQLFGGKRYLWEAYIKDDAECELNCKPIGMKYFATLNKTVVDGTACFKPFEYFRRRDNGKAICVEGVCKAVHNSGVISGQFMNSGAVKCGGQICKPITGVFTKNPLQSGYVDVATIPAGASNISITELKNSANFLVLKAADGRYIINGDYTVSQSGLYEEAGTVFDYRRLDGFTNNSRQDRPEGVTEWITCTGPTLEPVHLMILAQQSNPGVKFEYLAPIQPNSMTNSEEESTNDSEEIIASKQGLKAADAVTSRPHNRRRRFSWKIVGYTACNKTCGGGIQMPVIKCIRENPTRVFNPRRCAHLKQPTVGEGQMKCNTQPCPAYWKLSEWTDCKCGQYNEEEWRSREVKCVQELVSGIVIQVNHAACAEDEPKEREKCSCQKAVIQKPESIMQRPGGGKRRKVEEARKHGTWLMMPWSKECSAVCGMGLQYRSIFCDRASAPNSERCDLRVTPETTRECSTNEKCAFGEWFTGPWSKCAGDCFNLTKGRSIVCIKNDAFAADEDCNATERPTSTMVCEMNEVDYCRPKWHYAEWTDCSKKCGGGTQRRIVKCVEPNAEEGQLKESSNCRYAEREVAFRPCNEEKCPELSTTTEPYFDPRVDMVQNDSTCIDDFPNCHLVIKAKLCSYSYYTNHCCQSCRIQSNELY